MDPDPTELQPNGGTPARRRFELAVVLLALAVLAGAVLLRAPAYLGGPEPVGEDSSSHILASATIAEHLRAGSDGWWMPHLNLGFPLAHFYQPLPHCVTAVVALALGGPEEAARAYKLLVVLLLVLLPGAAYVGFRRFGLARGGALVAALALATLSAPREYYGLTPRHFLLVGLYTLLFGTVLVPLALGEGVRFVQGRGRASLAVGAYSLLFLSHGLLGLGLIPVFALAAVLGGAEPRSSFRARGLRLVGLGLASGAVIACWLLPQLTCSDYFAGWPIGAEERADGLGLANVLVEGVRGRFTDLRRPPVLAVLALLGLGAAAFRVRRAEGRILLASITLFGAFTAGRETFGSLVDWIFPPNRNIEGMLRWMALLQLFLAAAAGFGVQELLALAGTGRVKRFRGGALAFVLVPAAVLAFTLPGYAKDLDWGLATFFESMDRPAYLRVAERLRDDPHPGRVHSAGRLAFDSHWTMAYTPMLTAKPMTLSKGVGVNESLNFYYLWFYDPTDPVRGAGESALFNVRYLLVRSDADVSALGAEPVARSGPYAVVRLGGEYGYFDVIAAPEVVEGARPTELRKTFLDWLKRDYPRGARYLRMREPLAVRFPSLPARTRDSGGAAAPPPARARPVAERAEKPGTVRAEEAGLRSYRAELDVREDDSWALLKVTPHPFWRAEVDGRASPIHALSPAFMGLPVGRGAHEVVFTFRNPAWQKLLLVLAPLVLAALAVRDLRRRRTAPAPRP